MSGRVTFQLKTFLESPISFKIKAKAFIVAYKAIKNIELSDLTYYSPLSLLYSHSDLSAVSKLPGKFLPQDLCVSFGLYLVYSSSKHTHSSFPLHRLFPLFVMALPSFFTWRTPTHPIRPIQTITLSMKYLTISFPNRLLSSSSFPENFALI